MHQHIGLTFAQHTIIIQQDFPNASGKFSTLLNEILVVGKTLRNKIALADIGETLGESYNSSKNIHGEITKELDHISNNLFKHRLLATGLVSTYISEEDDEPAHSTDSNAKYVIAIDPCDGSSNIECNVPIGTIFGIWDKNDTNNLIGRNMVCSGYILYGPSCMFVYTCGNGVYGFTYDPSIGEFILTHQNMKFPAYSKCYSINESYSTLWTNGVKNFVEWIKTPNKEDHRPYTSRYVGSLVSDFHRNLLYGGVFVYPTDKRTPNGKLRLLYECAPLSFIAEQAGGLSSDGKNNILDIIPLNIHQRVPLFIGNKNDVLMAQTFLENDK
jgi:fructose-1,6-bisphosphatase I